MPTSLHLLAPRSFPSPWQRNQNILDELDAVYVILLEMLKVFDSTKARSGIDEEMSQGCVFGSEIVNKSYEIRCKRVYKRRSSVASPRLESRDDESHQHVLVCFVL
jgi:hypothetical protein